MRTLTRLVFLFGISFVVMTGNGSDFPPELPDFTKWSRTGWDLMEGKRKNRDMYIVDWHLERREGGKDFNVGLYFKPLAQEYVESIKQKSAPESKWDEKLSLGMPMGKAWFVIYMVELKGRTEKVLLFERNSKWFEFWRLWQPQWRFVKDLESLTVKEEKEFFEKRYGTWATP